MRLRGGAHSFEIAATGCARLRGMLFRQPDSVTRLLVPCHDVHTYGMQYNLDIAFIAQDGRVLEVHRNVSAGRRIKRKEASMVAERFSQHGPWLKAGDNLVWGVAYE